MSEPTSTELFRRLEELNEVGISLSKVKDTNRLLEAILVAAKKITNADGGTLYRVDADKKLVHFEILRTDSLSIAMGGTTGVEVPFYPVRLFDDNGRPNNSMVVAYSVLRDETVNIADAYLAESLASQAAVALTNRQLIDQLESLFESFINLMNAAIDDKSPYTGGHCQRVPMLTMMLAEAVNDTNEGPLADFAMTDKDRYELKIAGLLHDCGKVTTPVHVVDKATKLQTIFDRIGLIDTRFEVVKRDAEIAALRAKLAARDNPGREWEKAERELMIRLRQINEDRQFLRFCNFGSEAMHEEDQERVCEIARAYRWRDVDGNETEFLTADEVKNLTIRSGTLTEEERQIINHHVEVTIRMLESLPWPKHLKNVPEYAGGHHERMDGNGYPRGLTRQQMSVQARVMCIADIFEALTAKDRPYKKGKTLTESLHILGKFKLNGHIDPDLFDVFVREKVYLKYAEQFLDPEQIDEVDLSAVPGYVSR